MLGTDIKACMRYAPFLGHSAWERLTDTCDDAQCDDAQFPIPNSQFPCPKLTVYCYKNIALS